MFAFTSFSAKQVTATGGVHAIKIQVLHTTQSTLYSSLDLEENARQIYIYDPDVGLYSRKTSWVTISHVLKINPHDKFYNNLNKVHRKNEGNKYAQS